MKGSLNPALALTLLYSVSQKVPLRFSNILRIFSPNFYRPIIRSYLR